MYTILQEENRTKGSGWEEMMSERGSFVTEYIYCNECFEAAKKILLGREKYLCSAIIPSWCDQTIPIIAGKVGGMYRGEEIDTFKKEYIPELEKIICHPMRIAILAEIGQEIITIEPK